MKASGFQLLPHRQHEHAPVRLRGLLELGTAGVTRRHQRQRQGRAGIQHTLTDRQLQQRGSATYSSMSMLKSWAGSYSTPARGRGLQCRRRSNHVHTGNESELRRFVGDRGSRQGLQLSRSIADHEARLLDVRPQRDGAAAVGHTRHEHRFHLRSLPDENDIQDSVGLLAGRSPAKSPFFGSNSV